jgi:hypothetical protein
MPIGLGPKRDDRRRRALMDDRQDSTERGAESNGEAVDRAAGSLTSRKRRRPYAASARRKNQLTIVDLLPRRWWALLLVWLGLGAVATLVSSWVWAVRGNELAAEVPFQRVPNWGEVATRAHLWALSLTLTFAAFVSTQIYLIRRHRADDYRGHYRIWAWAAVGFIMASFDATVGLHRWVFFEALGKVSRQPAQASLWMLDWILLPLGLLVVLRLVWEMWGSRAKWGLVAATLGLLSAGLWPWGMGLNESETSAWIQVMLLTSSCCLLASLITYGRYTLLDAHGLIVTKTGVPDLRHFQVWQRLGGRKERLESTVKPKTVPDEPQQGEPGEEDSPTLRPVLAKGTSRRQRDSASEARSAMESESQTHSECEEDETDQADAMIHSLSKAQRKKLSKKQRRQQRRAA